MLGDLAKSNEKLWVEAKAEFRGMRNAIKARNSEKVSDQFHKLENVIERGVNMATVIVRLNDKTE